MIVTTKQILDKAKEGGYAVGAFNTVNLETTKAILNAAKELRSPIVIQMTEKTLDYAGGRAIFMLVKTFAESYLPGIPVAIHLDHGKSFDIVERAIEVGFSSVMYDGSRHTYNDNLRVTKKVVTLAHGKGVSVQAELGNVPYLSEVSSGDVNWDEYMTDPEQAAEFVRETGIDLLAVAIGNAHGFTRERDVPDYDRLAAIRAKVALPLVLHGASDWEEERAKKVIGIGISCFNVDTATRLAFIGTLTKTLEGSSDTDIRTILGAAMTSVEEVVKQKIRMYGSEGKA
jgi:fructose-bisphosphate aldolase class II